MLRGAYCFVVLGKRHYMVFEGFHEYQTYLAGGGGGLGDGLVGRGGEKKNSMVK